jgi:asparaginyl-tRNA synthetase
MAEFWMIEPELAFADVFDTMECAEAYIQFCIRYILENNKKFLQNNYVILSLNVVLK